MQKLFIILISVFLMCSCTTNTEPIKVIDIDTEYAKEIMENNNYVIIDVRETYEYEEEHIKGSINIPLSSIDNIEDRVAKQVEVILYCKSGNRSKEASEKLIELGYTKVYNLGGIDTITLEKTSGGENEEIS